MLEESMSALPSLWASIFSWCTPAVLFVILNLTIGTIFFTSGLTGGSNERRKQQESQSPPPPHSLARSPSVLHRLKSINFYNYRSQESVGGFEKALNLDLDSHFNFPQSPEPEPKSTAPILARSPSMLDRFKSMNLSSYLSHDSVPNFPFQTAESDSQVTVSNFSIKTADSDAHSAKSAETQPIQPQIEAKEQEKPQIEEPEPSLDEIYSKIKQTGIHVERTKSDTKPSSGEIPKKLPRKMKKSASTKSAFAHFEEENIQSIENRRPATTREIRPKIVEEADEEVDARADDFINKFKQQLKLQRIDSIIRYKEMVHRGSDNCA